MRSALRLTSTTLGVYAGLLGIEHGIFETLQGSITPNGVLINSIGAPCQTEAIWHGCFPALTLIPNVLLSGIFAMLSGLCMLAWSVAFIQRERGGQVLLLLSILLFLVGGGFVSTFIGLIAGSAACKFQIPSGLWRLGFRKTSRFLAKPWPWALVLMGVWLPGSWLIGHYFNQAMLNATLVTFLFFDVGLPLLAVLSGFAYDTQQR